MELNFKVFHNGEDVTDKELWIINRNGYLGRYINLGGGDHQISFVGLEDYELRFFDGDGREIK